MTMTRQHFALIAEVITDAMRARELGPNECTMLAERFADALNITAGFNVNGNRRFDRARFLRACGVADD